MSCHHNPPRQAKVGERVRSKQENGSLICHFFNKETGEEVTIPHNTVVWAYEWAHGNREDYVYTFAILVDPVTRQTLHALMCRDIYAGNRIRLKGAGDGSVGDTSLEVIHLPS